MKQPLKVGVSACFFHADPRRAVFKGKTLQYLEQSMANWILLHGALAYLIPAPPERSPIGLTELVEPLDGLVLQGGSDVAPESYQEKPLKPEWSGDRVRDLYEMALVHEFMAQGKPILGICRGAQLLNVALGGTLYQDIEQQKKGALTHRDWNVYDQNFHGVRIEGGLSKLYSGQTVGRVNSVHHQAIKDVGKNLRVEAVCENDGVIEAVRFDGPSYALAVQWHPEFQDPGDSSLLSGDPVLEEFLQAARERKR
jgi:putative glutamine amidotransferase